MLFTGLELGVKHVQSNNLYPIWSLSYISHKCIFTSKCYILLLAGAGTTKISVAPNTRFLPTNTCFTVTNTWLSQQTCVYRMTFVCFFLFFFVATKSLLCQLSPMIAFICRCCQSLARLVTPGEDMQFHWAWSTHVQHYTIFRTVSQKLYSNVRVPSECKSIPKHNPW